MTVQRRGDVVYMDDQAPGAWANGMRVRKSRLLDPTEITPVGALGTVVGSMAVPDEAPLDDIKYGYFIEWDLHPDMPTFCVDKKLELVQ